MVIDVFMLLSFLAVTPVNADIVPSEEMLKKQIDRDFLKVAIICESQFFVRLFTIICESDD
jgi:hypothetical protein